MLHASRYTVQTSPVLRLTPEFSSAMAANQMILSVAPSSTAGDLKGCGIGRPSASVTPLDCRNCAHFGSMNNALGVVSSASHVAVP